MGHPKGQKRDFDALERRRMEALRLFRKGIAQAQIARQLKVARQTVSRWVRQYREGGKAALRKAGRAGRLPRLDSGQLKQLNAMLVAGPESFGYPTPLWTCPRVAEVIEAEFGIRYHPGHVWKLLRALGFSCQRPVGRAIERDEKVIAAAVPGFPRSTAAAGATVAAGRGDCRCHACRRRGSWFAAPAWL